jgi:putative sterol carrier protein
MPAELAGADPNALAGMVGQLSDAELKEVMASELRGQVLDEIFRRMGDHFRADKAKGQNVAVHFVITGGPNATVKDSYQASIKDGVCTTSKDLTEHPRATITADGVHFLRLVTGGVGGVELFLKGKLKVGGDMMFAAQVAGWFAIPGGK